MERRRSSLNRDTIKTEVIGRELVRADKRGRERSLHERKDSEGGRGGRGRGQRKILTVLEALGKLEFSAARLRSSLIIPLHSNFFPTP